MSDAYEFSGICLDCKHETVVPLSKRVAAFFAVLGPSFCCEQCGSEQHKETNLSLPEIDSELLNQWLEDVSLRFMGNETCFLFMAPFKVLSEGFDRTKHAGRKKTIAISMAIRLYDNAYTSGEEQKSMEAWLRKHMASWNDYFDYDYVSRDVAKRLGIA